MYSMYVLRSNGAKVLNGKSVCSSCVCLLFSRNRPVDFVTASFTTSYSRSSVSRDMTALAPPSVTAGSLGFDNITFQVLPHSLKKYGDFDLDVACKDRKEGDLWRQPECLWPRKGCCHPTHTPKSLFLGGLFTAVCMHIFLSHTHSLDLGICMHTYTVTLARTHDPMLLSLQVFVPPFPSLSPVWVSWIKIKIKKIWAVHNTPLIR